MQNSHFVLGQIAFLFLNRKGPPNFYCNNFWQNIQGFPGRNDKFTQAARVWVGRNNIIKYYDKYKKH